jgi:hypothetical protein
MDENEFENGEKKRNKVIIEDKRFMREGEEAAKPEPAEGEPAAKKEKPHAHTHKHPAEQAPPEGEEQAVNIFDLGIEGFLEYNLGMIYQFALVYLGLIANPTSGLIARDLERAKLCIDVFEFLSGKVKALLPKEAQDELGRVTKDLKMNFIQVAASPTPAPPAPAQAPPTIIKPPDAK